MAAYHLEALRRQRVIDRKQGALFRIQQVSLIPGDGEGGGLLDQKSDGGVRTGNLKSTDF